MTASAKSPCQHLHLVKVIKDGLVRYHCAYCPLFFVVAKQVVAPKPK